MLQDKLKKNVTRITGPYSSFALNAGQKLAVGKYNRIMRKIVSYSGEKLKSVHTDSLLTYFCWFP